MAEYNEAGRLVHEPQARDGERLDAYLARVRPDLGDEAFWLAQCEADRVSVRDKLSLATGTFDRTSWYLTWFDGARTRYIDLAVGERPRMRHGYCHIVKEGGAP